MQKSPDVASRGRSFACISGSKENFSTFNLAFWRENNILLSFSIQETRDRNNEPQTSHAPFPQQQRQKANPNTSRVHYWLFRLLATHLYTRATLLARGKAARALHALNSNTRARVKKFSAGRSNLASPISAHVCVCAFFLVYLYARLGAFFLAASLCLYILQFFIFPTRKRRVRAETYMQGVHARGRNCFRRHVYTCTQTHARVLVCVCNVSSRIVVSLKIDEIDTFQALESLKNAGAIEVRTCKFNLLLVQTYIDISCVNTMKPYCIIGKYCLWYIFNIYTTF